MRLGCGPALSDRAAAGLLSGAVTASVSWGDQRTFTMREDAFNKSSPEPLHLNPQAPK